MIKIIYKRNKTYFLIFTNLQILEKEKSTIIVQDIISF